MRHVNYCSVEGCIARCCGWGRCRKHYYQLPEVKARITAFYRTPEQIARKKARSKIYNQTHKHKAYQEAFRATAKGKEYQKVYNQTPERKAYYKAHQQVRLQIDPLFRFKHAVRGLIRASFKNQGFKKSTKTFKLLGCDFETAYKSICWFPGCEIHHIIPMKTALTEADVVRLSHYTNLIALTKEEHYALHSGVFELILHRN